MIMNQTLIYVQEANHKTLEKCVSEVQDQTASTKLMNVLTDSRSCGWWSGAISRSEIQRVLLSDHNVVHDLSSSFQLHLQGFVWKVTRVSHENVPPWKILRFERGPILVVT